VRFFLPTIANDLFYGAASGGRVFAPRRAGRRGPGPTEKNPFHPWARRPRLAPGRPPPPRKHPVPQIESPSPPAPHVFPTVETLGNFSPAPGRATSPLKNFPNTKKKKNPLLPPAWGGSPPPAQAGPPAPPPPHPREKTEIRTLRPGGWPSPGTPGNSGLRAPLLPSEKQNRVFPPPASAPPPAPPGPPQTGGWGARGPCRGPGF